ncbi:uncharacterized protein SAPINGB_P006386 [Magnusiomyces paraingens]|uniref:Extradiol ring-cleavage dioxygenase class III enzyme subunit B domain-containing protein n=1 Tax=Magnusiomyces paraingens TaxID=2606893 RepID=A0A5E8C5V9_9ASCO|nr:uncharacterized protein SAPINGB_P006386 [Saprochaete ingens]VVT58792.1 unnamed protein product [Saprochaete ingens]
MSRFVYPFITLIISILVYYFYFQLPAQVSTTSSPITTTQDTTLQEQVIMSTTTTATTAATTAAATVAKNFTSRLRPFYFVSHGGPTFMYRDDNFGDAGAWDVVTSIGKEILADPPKALVVISAHWQEESGSKFGAAFDKTTFPTVGVTSTDGENSLIYDFYGFPAHMYKEQFHSKGDKALAKRIAEKLQQPNDNEPGFNVKLHGSRGFDHGLWVPLRIAFPEQSIKDRKNYVPFPIIQISLPSSPYNMRSHAPTAVEYDTQISFRLGQLLHELRDRNGEDVAIVCSGMSVHNLRDLFSMGGRVAPYASKFDKELKVAVEKGPTEGMLDRLTALFKTPITKSAHPTLEHLLPIAVAAGVDSVFKPEGTTFDDSLTKVPEAPADPDVLGPIDFKPKQLYSNTLLSLAWGIFKFGRN